MRSFVAGKKAIVLWNLRMPKFKPKQQIGVGGLVLGDHEKRYLHEVIESNRLSYGPMTHRFEKEFAGLHACRYAIFCNSGTSALRIALRRQWTTLF